MALVSDLGSSAGVLSWDRETVMPTGGAEGRAQLLGTLAALHHRELVREDLAEPLARLADDAELDAEAAAAVRLAVRDRDRAARVPEDLVRELSEASSRCVSAWVEARAADRFADYAGPLARVIDLKRREAEAIGVGDEPYDALLDGFEPGARTAELAPVFEELTAHLRSLVGEASTAEPALLPERHWPEAGQMELAREIAAMVGFDLQAGVIARSAHPFTGGLHAGDVRFTTRVDPVSPLSSISAVMHELGHALYEQGFPASAARTPVYDAPSLGAHESQSRFWENHVGGTAPFWERVEPAMRRIFPDAMRGIDALLLHRASRVVAPSLIRVEADEVTYNLHIALRFRLELALVRGDLQVADLPGAFADGMEELLGIRPGNDAQGVMQDIHWADGLIGYFPTYTLGNLYAAQLAEAAENALGPLGDLIAEGAFDRILGWLRDHVHRHGAAHSTRDLMRGATGRELSADALLAHLRRGYLLR